MAAVDLVGDELCVVGDEAEERRATGVLPGEAEEVEPRNLADAATVAQAPLLVVPRQLHPRVVGPVAGRPDHGVEIELAAAGEAHDATVGGNRPRMHSDAVAADIAWARADQRVAAA